MQKNDFVLLVRSAAEKEVLKKLVLSRPKASEVPKISARLCAHRGKRILAMEYSLPGNTVSHKNLNIEQIESELYVLLDEYRQVNLITTLGDAEWKNSKSGKDVVLGGDNLKRKLGGERPSFESAIESLDKKKNYILSGKEKFLINLGISSSDGRVHDKKQGKFRQINRFLEHIEDIYDKLPDSKEICIYDLCCGKSYLSFAVYFYLTEIKGRDVYMRCVDLKRDVILWCEGLAHEIKYTGMHFEVGDISKIEVNDAPDMVISLHACDIATDIVLDTAIRLGARVILSTPCCHRYLTDKIAAGELSFVTRYPHLANKLAEAMTDSIRLARLRAAGYSVAALELTDPENTPKNTLLKAVKNEKASNLGEAKREYDDILHFVLGDEAKNYLSEIK